MFKDCFHSFYVILFIPFLMISFSSSAYADLTAMYQNDHAELYSIFFLDDQHGWACGWPNLMLRTVDGGESWLASSLQDTIPDHDMHLRDISFINNNVGFCMKSNFYKDRRLDWPDPHTLFRTTNGGETWGKVAGLSDSVVTYSFCDENNGYVASHYFSDFHWSLQKTSDAGNSWEIIREEMIKPGDLSRYPMIWDVVCTSPDTCFVLYGERSRAGTSWSYLDMTTDGGETWERIYTSDAEDSRIPFGRISQSAEPDIMWLYGHTELENAYLFGKSFAIVDVNRKTMVDFKEEISVLGASPIGSHSGLVFVRGRDLVPGETELRDYIFSTPDNGVTLQKVWRVPQALQYDDSLYNDLLTQSMLSFTAVDEQTIWMTFSQRESDISSTIYKLTIDPVGVVETKQPEKPSVLSVFPPTPNPFNPSTTIQYFLAERREVSISVYNSVGSKIITLVNHENQPRGHHEINIDGTNLGSGVYICYIKAGSNLETLKMVLIR